MGRELTRNQRGFLAAYIEIGTVCGAAKLAGLERGSHWRWMKESETYRAAFQQAEVASIDFIEDEVRHRAVEGWGEPVVYQGALQYEPERNKDGSVKRDKRGQPVLSTQPLTIKKFSDNLLMFWLKAKAPERFRDNSTVAVTGSGGLPLSIKVEFVKPAE